MGCGIISPIRIIPARAGFTDYQCPQVADQQDHPRSRGVYHQQSLCPCGCGGSSPLARGLRSPGHPVGWPGRIIPARAGFTAVGSPTRARPRDHPRSRGVYWMGRRWTWFASGSSPLARGLLCVSNQEGGGVQGIIPARAGFTIRSLSPRSDTRDHPRSRGVYAVDAPTIGGRDGSSPLARGLRVRQVMHAPLRRIIPARAGFTGDAAVRR